MSYLLTAVGSQSSTEMYRETTHDTLGRVEQIVTECLRDKLKSSHPEVDSALFPECGLLLHEH